MLTKKKKILIIEDEEEIVRALKIILEKRNYQVITSHDGEEGLEKASKYKPDLILLDILLPKIGGYKVCSTLKSAKKHQKIPVVIITAKQEKEDENLSYKAGADAFFTKPFDREKLLKKIETLLGN